MARPGPESVDPTEVAALLEAFDRVIRQIGTTMRNLLEFLDRITPEIGSTSGGYQRPEWEIPDVANRVALVTNELEALERIIQVTELTVRNQLLVLNGVSRETYIALTNKVEIIRRASRATSICVRDLVTEHSRRSLTLASLFAPEPEMVALPDRARQSTDPMVHAHLTNPAARNDPNFQVTQSLAQRIQPVDNVSELRQPIDTNSTDPTVEDLPRLTRRLAAMIQDSRNLGDSQGTGPSDRKEL